MYCSTCGAESVSGQTYCKRCGANLNPSSQPVAQRPVSAPRLGGMFWAISIFGLGSLATLLGCMVALAAVGVNSETLAIVGVFGSTTILGIAGLLIWQLARLITASKQITALPQQPGRLEAAPAYARIAEPPRPVASVTEHTTRNFEPRLVENENAGPDRQ